MSTNPHQLFLLADHVKLSLLKRQRAISLDLEPNKQDSHIIRSLETLREGIESLERQRFDDEAAGQDITALSDQITRLQSQHHELEDQFNSSSKTTASSTLTKPNDPCITPDFRAAIRTKAQRSSKSPTPNAVRFRDNDADEEETPADTANRSALFNQPYRDEPEDSVADQRDLSNQQIHTFHKQVLRDQDDQLETLGRSIGRQRDLSIQMGTELDEQAVMLRDVDEGVDRHQGALDRGNTRIKSISRKAKDNWSWLTIGILIIILVLLIVLLN